MNRKDTDQQPDRQLPGAKVLQGKSFTLMIHRGEVLALSPIGLEIQFIIDCGFISQSIIKLPETGIQNQRPVYSQ